MELPLATYEVKMLTTRSSYKGWHQLGEQTKGFSGTINHRQGGTDGHDGFELTA